MPCSAAAARNAWKSNSVSDESRSKKPLHTGGREREKKPARPLADALPGVREPPRDEDKGTRAPHAELVAKLPAKVALEDVDGLVLAAMEVQGRPLTRRGNGLERRERAIRLLAPDDEGDVTSDRAADALPLAGPDCDPLRLGLHRALFQTVTRAVSRD